MRHLHQMCVFTYAENVWNFDAQLLENTNIKNIKAENQLMIL